MPGYTFTIEGKAVPWRAPMVTRNGQTFSPKRVRDWEKYVAAKAKEACIPMAPKGTPVSLIVRFHIGVARSWPKKKQKDLLYRMHTQLPDQTNLIKAVEDGLNGIAYEDDQQVADLSVRKMWTRCGEDRVVVSVWWVPFG